MIFLGIVTGLVIGAIPLIRIKRARTRRALLRPFLNGIALPLFDDPRWKHNGLDFQLGPFLLSEDRLENEARVYLDGCYIGSWAKYGEAVRTQIKKRKMEALQNRSLRLLESGDI